MYLFFFPFGFEGRIWDLIVSAVPDHSLSFYFTVSMLGLRLVLGNVVPSLRSGGGDTLTRGLNEVHRKINDGTLRNVYIHGGVYTSLEKIIFVFK